VHLGTPILETALEQHDLYCRALVRCGLDLTRLDPDDRFPDSTFVEDTAILTERSAILTRPGAASREGEVAAVRNALAGFYRTLESIEASGTLDGGDVCEAGNHFFVGVSHRTNEEGARQLAECLARGGYTSSLVDIRGIGSILHLKSGIAFLGERRLAVIDALAGHPAFEGFEILRVAPGEEYAANCVRVNDHVLVAAGHPELEAAIHATNVPAIPLEMSEFRKMDGGLSCLSLRF
jgi:dimethylargininase